MFGMSHTSVVADYHQLGSESFQFQLTGTGDQWTFALTPNLIKDDIEEFELVSSSQPVNWFVLDTANYHECINNRPFNPVIQRIGTFSFSINWTVPYDGEQWYTVIESTSSLTTTGLIQINWYRWYDPDARFVERELHVFGYPSDTIQGEFTIHNYGQEQARGQVSPRIDHRPEITIAFNEYGFDINPEMSQTFTYTIEIASFCRVITFVKQIEITYYGPNVPVDTICLFIHIQQKPLLLANPFLSLGILISSFVALLGYWQFEISLKKNPHQDFRDEFNWRNDYYLNTLVRLFSIPRSLAMAAYVPCNWDNSYWRDTTPFRLYFRFNTITLDMATKL